MLVGRSRRGCNCCCCCWVRDDNFHLGTLNLQVPVLSQFCHLRHLWLRFLLLLGHLVVVGERNRWIGRHIRIIRSYGSIGKIGNAHVVLAIDLMLWPAELTFRIVTVVAGTSVRGGQGELVSGCGIGLDELT